MIIYIYIYVNKYDIWYIYIKTYYKHMYVFNIGILVYVIQMVVGQNPGTLGTRI
jgi:hypothetical protein